ncbi:iron ABC transporter permease [Paenibacillus sp. GSMTC-2017]|uniref:FecCD family ABC transporter permease n=1 Tax=Paenibacillus sp. GSMTC-2017 TaxID=2794350 RepID=UPI001A3403F1|nr:iron ABC transporter permease [Paenibacillus sp. GSMTC-2017]MBH5318717.1 iron ABC transporter permease [Paenibacillus sp. GSMTC-2017]
MEVEKTALVNRRASARRPMIIFCVVLLLTLVLSLLSISVGAMSTSLGETLSILFGAGTEIERQIIVELRLPGLIVHLLIGIGLAVSGAIMQGLTRNKLTDPGIMGIQAGAGLFIMLFVILIPSMFNLSFIVFLRWLGISKSLFSEQYDIVNYLLPIVGVGGAVLTALLVYLFLYRQKVVLSKTRILLTGILITITVYVAMLSLKFVVSYEDFQYIETWLIGSRYNYDWNIVFALLLCFIILLPIVIVGAWKMNKPAAYDRAKSDDRSNIIRENLLLYLAAAGIAGACVAIGGGIGFVGLLGPHIARGLVGSSKRMLLPVSALVGAILVVIVDIISRIIISPSQFPLGYLFAIIGIPYLIYVMIRLKIVEKI